MKEMFCRFKKSDIIGSERLTFEMTKYSKCRFVNDVLQKSENFTVDFESVDIIGGRFPM